MPRLSAILARGRGRFDPLLVKIDHLALKSILRWSPKRQPDGDHYVRCVRVLVEAARLAAGDAEPDRIVLEGLRGWRGDKEPDEQHARALRSAALAVTRTLAEAGSGVVLGLQG